MLFSLFCFGSHPCSGACDLTLSLSLTLSLCLDESLSCTLGSFTLSFPLSLFSRAHERERTLLLYYHHLHVISRIVRKLSSWHGLILLSLHYGLDCQFVALYLTVSVYVHVSRTDGLIEIMVELRVDCDHITRHETTLWAVMFRC